jgi:hypothetical protein
MRAAAKTLLTALSCGIDTLPVDTLPVDTSHLAWFTRGIGL